MVKNGENIFGGLYDKDWVYCIISKDWFDYGDCGGDVDCDIESDIELQWSWSSF